MLDGLYLRSKIKNDTRKVEKYTQEVKYSLKQTVKDVYKKLWVGILAMFLSIAGFAGSTYAWFTSTAVTNGNKVKTGIAAIDLIMSESQLIEQDKDPNDYKEYIRNINNDEGSPENYYIVTDEDVAVITLDNAEPGQIYHVKFKIANSGQLALTYSPMFAIQVDVNGNSTSLTGLQTLEKERAESITALGVESIPEDDYSYDDTLATQGLLTNRNYEIRKRVLINEQWNESENIDGGGHLEDVFEVYFGSNEEDINPDNKIGTISEIINPEVADKYVGYLLPYDIVKDSLPVGINVDIMDGETTLETKTGVSEVGELNLLLYLPEETNNLYEYASVILRVGVKATQVEYEKDGLGIMIYDKNARGEEEPLTEE